MTSILIADDDPLLRTALERSLRERGFDVRSTDSVDDALAMLQRAPVDILLTDLRMRGSRDGIDLLKALPDVAPRARAILMSAYASARDYQTAEGLGAVKVLCKPFTPEELMEAVHRAEECETGYRGSIHGLSLVDMLQVYHFSRRSLRIVIGGLSPAVMQMKDGQFVHAERAGDVGEAALRGILTAESGSIETGVYQPGPRSIQRPFQEVLLDAIRVLDETGAAASAIADLDVDIDVDLEWTAKGEPRAAEAKPTSPEPSSLELESPPQEPAPAPAAEVLDEGALEPLREAVARIAPDATLIAIHPISCAPVVLQGTLPSPDFAVVVADIARSMARNIPDWSRAEYVAREIGVVLVRGGRHGYWLAYCDVFAGRHAAMRFRAAAQRVLGSG